MNNHDFENIVSVIRNTQAAYPSQQNGFSPGVSYPEYPFGSDISDQKNDVYEMIRESFRMLGMDDSRYGTPQWSPLSEIIQPGETVLLKPNLVYHRNFAPENGLDCLITHPSLVRAMVDYVYIALRGKGNIIVADAPMQSCEFDVLKQNSGYNQMLDFYDKHQVHIEFLDLRNVITKLENDVLINQPVVNSNENVTIDLGQNSYHAGLSNERYKNYRILDYDPTIMTKHHNADKNEYLVAKKILDANVIINMPKPKTHRKAGVTIALKNLVGINTNKEWLPHHTKGSKMSGKGDEYLISSRFRVLHAYVQDLYNYFHARNENSFATKLSRKILGYFNKKAPQHRYDFFSEGSWYGNDTIWRTILDLNLILRYVDSDGNLQKTRQRKVFNVADMIISGEAEGPLLPKPKDVGIIAMAYNSVCMDEVIAALMGVDIEFIPTIRNARSNSDYPLCTVDRQPEIVSNDEQWNLNYAGIKGKPNLNFEMPSGWREYNNPQK
ncbi:MAG: DUF362 domain-containing protein [Thermoguttaceae bacterium]|nr:DUF362 domain-containing protein [Thermoguttaceae bacterium]